MQNNSSRIPEGTPINAANLQNAVDDAVEDAFEEHAPIISQTINNAVDSALDSNGNPLPIRHEDYRLTPEAMWPPPVFIRKNIGPQERFYLEHRWYAQWSFFDKKASENKNKYLRLQVIIGVGSVTVPVLVGIRADGVYQEFLYLATVLISLSVAVAAAIENINKYGDNWRSYRQAAEDLKQEKSLYDVRSGRYADLPNPFVRFVERTEEIVAQQNGRWVQSVEKQQTQAAEQVDEILDGSGEEGDIITAAEDYRYGTRSVKRNPSQQSESVATPIQTMAPEPVTPAAQPDLAVQAPPSTDYVEPMPEIPTASVDYAAETIDSTVASANELIDPNIGIVDPALGSNQSTAPVDDPNYVPDIG